MQSFKPASDLGIAGALCAALALVYGFDSGAKSSPQAAPQVTIENDVDFSGTGNARKPLRLGVMDPPQFDDMGGLLDTLGQGYAYKTFQLEEILAPQKLAEFDVLFLTCGGVPSDWLGERLSAGPRAGTESFAPRREILEKVGENLRNFVANGGTLYASDWQFQLVQYAFPDITGAPEVGQDQTLTAQVVDAGLQQILGSEIELRFDMPSWYPAVFNLDSSEQEEGVTIYLEGTYLTLSGSTLNAPLLVKFPYKQGSVIFTSFHNEKQNSELETKLLKYLVFAAVTAKTDADINRTLVKGGFSPANKSLLSASSDSPSVTQKYNCKKQADTQFVLGFNSEGATLKLTVTGPDGKTLEKQGTSTFSIEVPAAAVGEWTYTVTAVSVPYPNFPFTLTIGQK